eukprot:Phypoly_transcript_14415.p1 GENE.Phypoly_transcript_14415~~Phypoly_transcript_14415.p1  ORF type:complete len:178 (-),score=32.53 Phypoly_transcript_14415:5-538(-)
MLLCPVPGSSSPLASSCLEFPVKGGYLPYAFSTSSFHSLLLPSPLFPLLFFFLFSFLFFLFLLLFLLPSFLSTPPFPLFSSLLLPFFYFSAPSFPLSLFFSMFLLLFPLLTLSPPFFFSLGSLPFFPLFLPSSLFSSINLIFSSSLPKGSVFLDPSFQSSITCVSPFVRFHFQMRSV